MKRSYVKKRARYTDRNSTVTASLTETNPTSKPRSTQNYTRVTPKRPALEHIDVEEWDCPKPGAKKNLPKALKDNIRKNRKAYETYYKNRNTRDSLSSGNSYR